MTLPALISDICTEIVGQNYRVCTTYSEHSVLIEVFVVRPHTGFLIGREGQLVDALRIVLNAAGWREGRRVYVSVEAEG